MMIADSAWKKIYSNVLYVCKTFPVNNFFRIRKGRLTVHMTSSYDTHFDLSALHLR